MKEQQHRPDQENITESIDVEEFMAKYDRESDYARYSSYSKWIVVIIAISFSLFQLYTAAFGVLDAHLQRAVHLSLRWLWSTCFIPCANPGPEGVFTP